MRKVDDVMTTTICVRVRRDPLYSEGDLLRYERRVMEKLWREI